MIHEVSALGRKAGVMCITAVTRLRGRVVHERCTQVAGIRYNTTLVRYSNSVPDHEKGSVQDDDTRRNCGPRGAELALGRCSRARLLPRLPLPSF